MKTYDEILTAMKKAFFDSCGRNVDNMGDIDARFQAVASELFSLGCKNDFLLKQAFPQTATGDYLDRHAAMRDIQRHTGTKAHGVLRFSVSQPTINDISIPISLTSFDALLSHRASGSSAPLRPISLFISLKICKNKKTCSKWNCLKMRSANFAREKNTPR